MYQSRILTDHQKFSYNYAKKTRVVGKSPSMYVVLMLSVFIAPLDGGGGDGCFSYLQGALAFVRQMIDETLHTHDEQYLS